MTAHPARSHRYRDGGLLGRAGPERRAGREQPILRRSIGQSSDADTTSPPAWEPGDWSERPIGSRSLTYRARRAADGSAIGAAMTAIATMNSIGVNAAFRLCI